MSSKQKKENNSYIREVRYITSKGLCKNVLPWLFIDDFLRFQKIYIKMYTLSWLNR